MLNLIIILIYMDKKHMKFTIYVQIWVCFCNKIEQEWRLATTKTRPHSGTVARRERSRPGPIFKLVLWYGDKWEDFFLHQTQNSLLLRVEPGPWRCYETTSPSSTTRVKKCPWLATKKRYMNRNFKLQMTYKMVYTSNPFLHSLIQGAYGWSHKGGTNRPSI